MRRLPVIACTLFLASYARAEVMDKEMSIPDIWRSLLIPLIFVLAASLVHRWLLFLSVVLGMAVGPLFAWTEWYDPYVGPAIKNEAGGTYGLHANGAVAALLLAHMLGWGFALQRARGRLKRRGHLNQRRRDRLSLETIAFSCFMLAITVVGATTGFGGGPGIWFSPPLILGVIGL